MFLKSKENKILNTSAPPCLPHSQKPLQNLVFVIEKQKSIDYDIKDSQCADPTLPINPKLALLHKTSYLTFTWNSLSTPIPLVLLMLLPLTKILYILLSFNLKLTLFQGQIQDLVDLVEIFSNQKNQYPSFLVFYNTYCFSLSNSVTP